MPSVIKRFCSSLDSIFPFVVQRWVLAFRCDSSNAKSIVKRLEHGLCDTAKQIPWLTGHVARETDAGPNQHRLAITYAPHGYHQQISTKQLRDLSDNHQLQSYEYLARNGMFSARLRTEQLFSPPFSERLEHRPLSAQVNFLDGGCLLAISLHHSVFDGIGAGKVIEHWATSCKRISEGFETPQETDSRSLDETVFDAREYLGQRFLEPQLENLSWQLLGLKATGHVRTAPDAIENEEMESAMFYTLNSEIAAARDQARNHIWEPITSFDILAAMIWRAVIRARTPDIAPSSRVVSRLRIPVNIRSSLGLSPNYLGNAILNSVSQEPQISAQSFADIALKVSRDKSSARAANHVTAAIGLSHALPKPELRNPLFDSTTQMDVVLTSWKDLPFYLHDWGQTFGPGLGTVEFAWTPTGDRRGLCSILPSRPGSKITEVSISLTAQQKARLLEDEDFVKFFRTSQPGTS